MAESSGAVRLKLRFCSAPPGGPQCCRSWILLDQNRCRVIADLCSEIQERFGFSRSTQLDLYIDEFYLPTTESIYLIRDNDSIRVKVSSVSCVSPESEKQGLAKKRRREDAEEEELLQKDEALGPKKKSRSEGGQVNGFSQTEETLKKNRNKKKRKKKMNEQKKKKKEEAERQKQAEVAESLRSKTKGLLEKSSKKTSVNGNVVNTSRKQEDSSDSSDCSPQKHPPAPKPNIKSKPMPKVKESSSSESSTSSENEAEPLKKPNKLATIPQSASVKLQPTLSTTSTPSANKPSAQPSSSILSPSPPPPPVKKNPPPAVAQNGQKPNPPSTPAAKIKDSSDSDSSSETELVIRTPNPLLLGGTSRGSGRGRARGGVRGGFGRARGTPWKKHFHFNYDEQQQQEDSQTNSSLLIENPLVLEPKRDYSTLPLLAAPPAAGQRIAFKLLELTENYTPEVSEYKEGKIIGFNHVTNMVELELLSQTHARSEPGKFDLVYQNPDGSERVEYAVTLGSQLTERWDSLLEPRLIMENSS
ncbi:coilin [Hoplias malabaricus]|uniref:coilin n=1 Tax=Hoplias malabaricus TaxID=27720 RepID=UPI003462F12C